MGLDIHSLNLLRLAQKSGADFSNILMVSRLGLFLSAEELADYPPEVKAHGFCEPFLKHAFGAGEIVSVDASPYDGATLIHDLNLPLTDSRRFSAILDFGTLEHVFNFPVAIGNLITVCRDGGHLLHALPANNWCGHGFYQFSPELFFSLYSERRGFRGTQVFLVETNRPDTWYRVRSPLESGKRVNVVNRERTLIVVLTQKTPEAWHAHNLFLDIALQTGLPGLALLVVLLAATLRAAWRLGMAPDDLAAACGIALAAVVAGMVVRNMTDVLWVRSNALLYWGVAGALLGFGVAPRAEAPAR